MMTERKAATIANEIYAAYRADKITARQASMLIQKIEFYLSPTALTKALEFLHGIRGFIL